MQTILIPMNLNSYCRLTVFQIMISSSILNGSLICRIRASSIRFRNSTWSAKIDLCRKAARRRKNPLWLQHPKGVHVALGAQIERSVCAKWKAICSASSVHQWWSVVLMSSDDQQIPLRRSEMQQLPDCWWWFCTLQASVRITKSDCCDEFWIL